MLARTRPRLALTIAAALLASCNYKDDPNYCPGNPHQNCLNDAGPISCDDDRDCPAEVAVCDTAGSRTCVQCTTQRDDACTGSTPACIDNTCGVCTAHDQCDSRACLTDGSCADPGQVAYVAPQALGGSDNPSCTLAMPCTRVARALQTGRPYVKLAGTNDEGATLTIDNRNVTLLADPGARLVRTSNGLHVEIRGTSQVEIHDLEISGASGAQGIGISMPAGNTARLALYRAKVLGNTGLGISANGGELAVSQSTISGNTGGGISASGSTLTVAQSTISNNTGGGISVSNASFAIVGNVFFANGVQTGTVGGLSISAPENPANRLELNSFNKNAAADGFGPAIQCMVAGPFTARNNILSDNGTLTNMNQVGGTCAHAYSIVRPGTVPPGAGNSSMDPLFVNTTTGDLHLRPGSPALGAADPNSDLTGPAARDLDGDLRRAPADLGADEVP